jgi:hypothetical protein
MSPSVVIPAHFGAETNSTNGREKQFHFSKARLRPTRRVRLLSVIWNDVCSWPQTPR